MALAPRDTGARLASPHASPDGGQDCSSPDGSSDGRPQAGDDAVGTAIARGMAAREPQAIEDFFEQYRALILHCIGQFESAHGAREDLLQEVLGVVLERLDRGSFDPNKGTFGTWVYRVAWCRCVDLKRRESAANRLTTVPVSEMALEPSDERPDPGRAVGELEVGELVQICLEELEPELAELLRMRHMRGMTLVDIAALRSQSLETVKYRLKRATQALRQRLAERKVTAELVG